MNKYTPRRANKERWLKDAPEYVLDCFDDKRESDRYTVLLIGDAMVTDGSYAGTWMSYLSMDADGSLSPSGEMRAYDVANYRYRNSKRRVRWMDLPEAVRKEVIEWMKPEADAG